MEGKENSIKLYYNTEKEKLAMPEYGRNVLGMVEQLREIEDREKRTRQAKAVIKVMEMLNPQVRQQEDYEHKLWDHLYLIAGLDLDVDSPYPAPKPEVLAAKPLPIPLKDKPIRATHYGRNIESIIDLIASEEDGEVKTAMMRSLAIYMRQQYLIWNKDSVADETIFSDIEKMSDYRIRVPEGLTLSKIASDASFSRPGMGINVGQVAQKKNRNKNSRRNNNNKKNNR